ncbi:PREDICTED: L-ascorbate oxidase [Prunus dulcis]|uniref:PREDICTED: L-ascorbate oxidase n=1 Tax=Prunus dulcis TaxID=3755 RepID=A0A5E4FMN1_PRUDU|nr:PREDICTED: L-ascorbate oxidase [Prunus dulcis]
MSICSNLLALKILNFANLVFHTFCLGWGASGRFNYSLLATPSLEAGVCNMTNPECSPYILIFIPGKTHFVLVTANQDPSRNYWVTTNVVSRKPVTPTGLAILNYYPKYFKKSPPTLPTTGLLWNDTAPRLAQSLALKAHKSFIHSPPFTSNKVIVLLNIQNKINGYYIWSLNNVFFSLPHKPYLIALKKKLNLNLNHVFDQNPPPENYDLKNYDIYVVAKNVNATSSNGIYRLKFNTTVDIILQNANTVTVNNSETHPWHLLLDSSLTSPHFFFTRALLLSRRILLVKCILHYMLGTSHDDLIFGTGDSFLVASFEADYAANPDDYLQ